MIGELTFIRQQLNQKKKKKKKKKTRWKRPTNVQRLKSSWSTHFWKMLIRMRRLVYFNRSLKKPWSWLLRLEVVIRHSDTTLKVERRSLFQFSDMPSFALTVCIFRWGRGWGWKYQWNRNVQTPDLSVIWRRRGIQCLLNDEFKYWFKCLTGRWPRLWNNG